MTNKDLFDISWKVTEEEYRANKALSYSTLATYEREGFEGIPHLFDKKSSSSLTFGSCVDAIITGGMEEFNERFLVADFEMPSETIKNIVQELYNKYKVTSLEKIDNALIITLTENFKYQLNWKPETRVKVIKEKGEKYYQLLCLAKDKTIINFDIYNKVIAAVNALKESESTRYYFAENTPFDDTKRYYQLKFKATLNNIEYRCMADLIAVDYKNKKITLVDLKTSSHTEYDFYKSFVQWDYHIQARLYYRIIKANLEKDEYFKDFKISNYFFIVVNKDTLQPLVWEFNNTKAKGQLIYGKSNNIIFRDPETIGEELTYYIKNNSTLPRNINTNVPNNIDKWLNSL